MRSARVSRRDLLRVGGLGAVGLALSDHLCTGSAPAAEAPAPPALPPLNRFPRMVQEHFVAQVRAIEQAGDKMRALLKTKTDAELYVQSMRRKVYESFGPFPDKTP